MFIFRNAMSLSPSCSTDVVERSSSHLVSLTIPLRTRLRFPSRTTRIRLFEPTPACPSPRAAKAVTFVKRLSRQKFLRIAKVSGCASMAITRPVSPTPRENVSSIFAVTRSDVDDDVPFLRTVVLQPIVLCVRTAYAPSGTSNCRNRRRCSRTLRSGRKEIRSDPVSPQPVNICNLHIVARQPVVRSLWQSFPRETSRLDDPTNESVPSCTTNHAPLKIL